MFEESKFVRLALLEKYTEHFKKEFKELLNAPATSKSEAKSRLSTLKVNLIDDFAIEVTYVGTTLHFQLSLTYGDSDKALGHVVCLHKYVASEKVCFNVLGSFKFNPAGVTDFPLKPDEEERTLFNSHGDIVMYYLDQAIASDVLQFISK